MPSNKPPMFGPSAILDLGTYEPRAGKSFWLDRTNNGHTLVCAPTRPDMGVDYEAMRLTDAEIAQIKYGRNPDDQPRL